MNFFIIKLRNIIRNSKKLNVIDRIDNDPKNSFLKLYLKFFLNHGMGWDGTKIFRPIPSHGTKKKFWFHPIPSHDFKKDLSHTMGWFFLSHPIPRGALVCIKTYNYIKRNLNLFFNLIWVCMYRLIFLYN